MTSLVFSLIAYFTKKLIKLVDKYFYNDSRRSQNIRNNFSAYEIPRLNR